MGITSRCYETDKLLIKREEKKQEERKEIALSRNITNNNHLFSFINTFLKSNFRRPSFVRKYGHSLNSHIHI